MDPLLVRIFDVDFYMCTPKQNLDVIFSQFRGSAVHQVPVIRVFGSTQNGKKICVHVHGIFPYFYIPYDGLEEPNGLMYKIACNLDKAINISLGQASSCNQHVYKIALVSGVPFYGYHSKKHQFFKVYLYNPIFIKRVNNLLLNEAVLGKLYQPHETHLNFTLQFMIDYNLHGMSNLILSQVKYRHEIINNQEDVFIEESVAKVSSCELECDTMGEYILNRQEIESGHLAANPGIAALWEDEKQRRRNKNEDSQLPHYLSLDKTNIPPTESHELFKRALQERLAVLTEERDKNDLNISVYPAECPKNKRILNCSFVDYHSLQNSQLNFSADSELDQTFTDTLNLTLDEDVLDLIEVLKDLEKNVVIEEDSLLSQVSKDEADPDEEPDMSISLDATSSLLDETMKMSLICTSDNKKENGESKLVKERDKIEYSIKIPQLDGNSQDFENFSSIQSVASNNCSSGPVCYNVITNKSKISSPNPIIKCESKEKSKKTKFGNVLASNVTHISEHEKQREEQEGQFGSKYFNIHQTDNYESCNTKLVIQLRNCLENMPTIDNKDRIPLTSLQKSSNLNMKFCKISPSSDYNKTQIDIDVTENPILYNNVGTESDHLEINKLKTNSSKPKNFQPTNITKIRVLKRSSEVKAARNMIEKDKLSYIIIDSLLNKEFHNSYRNSIAERVSGKNKVLRRKILLMNQLETCRELVVLLDRNSIKNTRKRNMPSLINDFFTTDSETDSHGNSKMEVIDTNMYVQSNKIKSKAKLKRLTYETHRKSMNYTSVDKKEFKEYSNYYVAQKCSRRAIKCLNMLEKGLKPVFRMIPAYRPYKFYEKLDRTNTNDNSAISTTPTKIKPMKTLKEILEAQKENEAKFFQSVNSVMENCSISDVKLLEEKKINTSNDVVEALKKRVLFLDGANDSASDDEDNRAKKHGTRKSSHTSYSSLPIFKKSSVIPNPGIPTRVSDQIKAKMKAVEDYTVNNLTNNYPSCDNIQKIKRKISFDVKSQEKTILEEKLSCATKSSAHQVNFIKNDVTISKTNDASVDNIMESFVERRIIVSSISDGVNEAIKVNNKLENNSNVGEQDEDYLSTSALYDIINDYQPQEGTSKCYSNKLLSPKTPESSRDSLSQELRNLKTRDHNSFEYYSGSKFISSEEDSMDYPVLNGTINDIIPINKNLMHLSGSSSDIICGQKSSQNSSEMLKESSVPSYNFIHYKPQYKPPTRRDVEQSLCNLEIPQVRAQEPFYSDANDATGSLEIGYNVLKIQTMTSADAQDFESTFSGIDDFRKKFFPKVSSKSKQHAVENSRYSYCKESNCMITPVKKPPSRQEVKNWLKEKSLQPKDSTKSKLKKKKIYFRPSQDGFSDDSLDLSLTLTPLTPKENTPSLKTPESESNVESDSKESSLDSDVTLTPKSSRSSSLITKSKRRRRIDRSIVLRKSALLSHSSEHSGVISGVTLNNTYGFKNSLYNYQNAKASIKHEYLTILAMEIHVNTRGNFKPNPEYDSIQAIFYCISNDIEDDSSKPRKSEGLFIVEPNGNESFKSISASTGMLGDIKCVKNELELFKEFTNFLVERDPDILIGYEIQMLSWGYLIERCFHLGINLIPELSRVKDKNLKFNEKETGDLRVTGRVVLDFWRLLRHEIALQSYTLQSTVYEILQQRIPKYSFKDLTTWWNHYTNLYRHRTINYYLNCVRYILKLVDQLDLVGRTSELARLFGIQFYEVLSRGSQFRVESMMLRLAKPLNYVAVSPSVQQRANMKAPEHIALVLEPESKLYTDPVIVLDFQSLYPSIIIAYNYCFSTCIGKVELLGKSGPFEFAATNLKISKERIKFLLKKNQLNFSPCGVGFVKKSVRDGIMPRMLREILDTRLMVKKSMKENKDDALLQKVLHNRQLGLKLIANVTYGYTAANFSGRMPAVELGDSIVSKARETLQRTIALVDSNKKWGVRVVYGDTDSLFVHCPGKSKEEAFAIGEQIVEAVGKENPDPVKLKLEKVYQPCILQTKKRYVGYMYESPEQKDPVYDAKGIETVRRDGCPAVSKMLEKCLRILFETKDVSRVKKYCVKQFNKIILGRISIQDLTFAKEFRGFTGYRPGACVPSLELAKRWVSIDKRAEPRRGERVPYVIINGPPGLPLIRLVRSPYELLNDPALKPNALYYITRVIIPPLNRCFNLIGADLHQWFHQMPRKQLQCLPTVSSPSKKSTISQYFVSTLCAICGTQTQDGLCEECRKRPQETVIILNEKVRQWETSYNNCKLICSTCSQILDEPKCISLNCPVLYRLHQTNRDLQQTDHIRQLLDQHFEYF